MTDNLWYYDCDQCGEIGAADSLKDHPDRPMPIDIGFCPKCGAEIRELFTEEDIRIVIASYDEDPDTFLAELKSKHPA